VSAVFAQIARSRPTAARRAGLAIILLVAFALRAWNLDWDHGTHQHPDERYWSIVTNDISWVGPAEYFSQDSELNPYSHHSTWVYGTFPLFTTKAVAGFLSDGPFPSGMIVTVAGSTPSTTATTRTSSDDCSRPSSTRPLSAWCICSGANCSIVGSAWSPPL
jgi:hypothetical protein